MQALGNHGRTVFNRCMKGPSRRRLLPFRYRTSFREATFSTRCDAFSFINLISATIVVFQINEVALACDLNRREAAVRSPTREKGDSTTLEVRRCFPLLAGKS